MDASLNDSDVFVEHFFLSTLSLGALLQLGDLNQVLSDLLLVLVLEYLNFFLVLLQQLLLSRVGFIAQLFNYCLYLPVSFTDHILFHLPLHLNVLVLDLFEHRGFEFIVLNRHLFL